MKKVCVIGGANVDISARPYFKINDKDSVPGQVTFGFGGVGRNIAENLAHLGLQVELITAFGDDTNGKTLIESCRKNKIGLKKSKILEGENTSVYFCLNGKTGDMLNAVSDMKILEHITPEFLNKNIDFINNHNTLVLDTNLQQSSIDFILKNAKIPIFIDTVSLTKTEKIKNNINKIFAIKPNKIEAEFLSGIKIKTYEDMKFAAEKILDMGVKMLFISLGENGVFFACENKQGNLNPFDVKLINTTGAGDSFISGSIFGYLKGYAIEDMAKCGLICSKLCLEQELAVNPNLNERVLENFMNIY